MTTRTDDEIPVEFRGRGRPRKNVPARNIKILTAADFGMTRRQLFEMVRLAEVPEDEFERIMALPHGEKISAIRHIKSGRWRRGAVDDDGHIRLPRELFNVLTAIANRRQQSASELAIALINRAIVQILNGTRDR